MGKSKRSFPQETEPCILREHLNFLFNVALFVCDVNLSCSFVFLLFFSSEVLDVCQSIKKYIELRNLKITVRENTFLLNNLEVIVVLRPNLSGCDENFFSSFIKKEMNNRNHCIFQFLQSLCNIPLFSLCSPTPNSLSPRLLFLPYSKSCP